MPFSPSDLPWWGWLICSFVAFGTCIICVLISDRVSKGEWFWAIVNLLAGLVGLVTGAMALILFVKWVWNG